MMNWKRIQAPLDDDAVKELRVSDIVLISGTMYAARDAAHANIKKIVDNMEDFPFDTRGQLLYYMGPSPAPPGKVVGAAGPTTSSRMDPYTGAVLSLGFRGFIGKGRRGPEVKKLLAEHRAVYMATFGGAAAYLGRKILKLEPVLFEDLGPEAFFRMEVEDFPAIIVNDIYGGDLYDSALRK
jgi:fumarate hydratase subunit beta